MNAGRIMIKEERVRGDVQKKQPKINATVFDYTSKATARAEKH